MADVEKSFFQIAIEKQSMYCSLLGTRVWEEYPYKEDSIVLLKNKLGFILFGSPKISEKNENGPESCQGCSSTGDSGSITCSDVNANVSEGCLTSSVTELGPVQSVSEDDAKEKGEIFHENNVTDDTFDFIVKLLDSSLLDLDGTLLPLIEKDSHQFLKLIFGNDCCNILINYIDENLAEIDSRGLVDSTRTTGSTLTAPQNPSSFLDEIGVDYFYYTDPKQIKLIDQLLGQIMSCSYDYFNNGLFVAFIFVIAIIDNYTADIPIIRVLNRKNNQDADIVYFIDLYGRCYDSWSKFLKDNILPSCIYCYPRNGFYKYDYDGNVLVEFDKSPESKVLRKFSKYGDIASNIAGLGCGGVALASIIFPFAAPVIAGTAVVGLTSGLWSTGRSIHHLTDRKLHRQKLDDNEAVGAWLGVATGVFSIASMGALNYTQAIAKNGRVLGKVANVVVNGIEITNTGLNGVTLGHQVYNMYKQKKFDAGDAVNLVLSVLFFYHSVMKFKTAKQVLLDSQNDVISSIENQLSRKKRKVFKKVVRGTTEKNLIEGNACVIETVLNLEDPNNFFENLSKVTKSANKSNSKVAFSEDGTGKVNINGKIEVQPDVFNSMSNKSKQKVFTSSRKYSQNQKFHNLFNRDIKIVSKKENLIFKKNTNELLKKMSWKNKQDIKINVHKSSNLKIFKNVNGFFKIMKCDNNYEKMNSQVKKEAKESGINLYSLIMIIFDVLNKAKEGKETFDRLMKYYEENLKDFLEGLIKDVDEFLSEIFKETNEDLTTVQRIFYLKVIKGNDYSSWKYLEIYFQKLWNVVPDPDTVVILRQKAGWLYFLPLDSEVRCVFIAPLRINADVEKVWLRAFIKNT